MKTFVSLCKIYIWLLLTLASREACGQQDGAICTSNVNDSRCQATNQVCIQNENGEEICGACQQGFVRFPINDTTWACVDIQDLDMNRFIDAFLPTFVNATISLLDRLHILQRSARLITEANLAQKPYTLTLNEFSAESFEERRQRNGYRYKEGRSLPLFKSGADETSLPLKVNWVSAGVVTPVVNQVICGCCWSIAAIGAIESKAAIDASTNTTSTIPQPIKYSFQQLISCDNENDGCNGGLTSDALQYAHDNSFGGITTFDDYPYQDRLGETTEECQLAPNMPVAVTPPTARIVVDMTDRKSSFYDRLKHMKQALVEQPIAIAMSANCDTLYLYGGGVLTEDGDCSCDKPSCLDHAVLLVGYDDTHDPPYLLIKNSWGRLWGEDGYFKVAQTEAGKFGLFGILAEGVFPSNNADYDEVDNTFDWWKILILSLAMTAAISVFVYAVGFLWRKCRNSYLPDDNRKRDEVD